MRVEEFNIHTLQPEMDQGILIYEDRKFSLKAVRNDCYHFVNVDQHEVKIIMDGEDVVYAHCDCDNHEKSYCPHEVACFLYILKQHQPDFSLDDYRDIDYYQDDFDNEKYFNVISDYQQMMDNDEFDLTDFLKDKSADDLLMIISMFDAINPELGVFVFQLYYDELMKNKKES